MGRSLIEALPFHRRVVPLTQQSEPVEEDPMKTRLALFVAKFAPETPSAASETLIEKPGEATLGTDITIEPDAKRGIFIPVHMRKYRQQLGKG